MLSGPVRDLRDSGPHEIDTSLALTCESRYSVGQSSSKCCSRTVCVSALPPMPQSCTSLIASSHSGAAAAVHGHVMQHRLAPRQYAVCKAAQRDRQAARPAAPCGACRQCRRQLSCHVGSQTVGHRAGSRADSGPGQQFTTSARRMHGTIQVSGATACVRRFEHPALPFGALSQHCSCLSQPLPLQGQPGHAALHRRLNLHNAATGRDGDAAEQDPLRDLQDSKAASPPQQPAAEPAMPPQSQRDAQHGDMLSDAEKQRAMTAALQQGLAVMRRNHSGGSSQNTTSSSNQPPAGPSAAADRGAKAAAAVLQQYGGVGAGRQQPAAPGTPRSNGAHPAEHQAPAQHPEAAHQAEQLPRQGAGAEIQLSQQPAVGPQLPTEPPLPRQQWPPKPDVFAGAVASAAPTRQRRAPVVEQ